MAYHIKKARVFEPSNFVYWEGGDRWSDDFSKRKTYVNKATADNKIVNSDGKNGGFVGAVVVEE